MTSSAPATACVAPVAHPRGASGTVTALSRAGRVYLTIAALVAGLVASMLSVASPARAATTSTSRTTYERSIENSVLKLINHERHVHGLKKVRMNKHLQRSARNHNAAMARFNDMSHQLRGEASLGRRIDRVGYDWGNIGENIAWNSRMNRAGVLQVQKLMYNEVAPFDGHRRNILSRHYREVGVDVYFDRAHDKIWLTTDFGRKR